MPIEPLNLIAGDTFDRADGPLDGSSTDSGSPRVWSSSTGITIQGNRARRIDNAGRAAIVVVPALAVEVSATLAEPALLAGANGVGITVRASDNQVTPPGGVLLRSGQTSLGAWQLITLTPTVALASGSTASGVPLLVGGTMRLRVNRDDYISAFINDVLVWEGPSPHDLFRGAPAGGVLGDSGAGIRMTGTAGALDDFAVRTFHEPGSCVERIPAESRRLVVPAESRRVAVPAESRRLEVAAC
jgi:hypothetical protein